LIAIAFPSFRLLYLLDEVTSPTVTIKVTGLNGLIFINYKILDKYFIIKVRCKLNTLLSPQLKNSSYLIANSYTFSSSTSISTYALSYKINTNYTNLTLSYLPKKNLFYFNDLFLSRVIISRRSLITCLIPKKTLITPLVSPIPVTKFIKNKEYFHTRCRAINRIGPHNIDVISVMVGLLLGDGYLNNRTGEGVRMAVKQSIVHKEYLFSLYHFFYIRGYCSSLEPRMYTRNLKGKDKTYYGYEFNTFTFRSLVWLHKLFYSNGKKIIPVNISDLLTPLALAIWISDDGG
jgi:hypothetical protein